VGAERGGTVDAPQDGDSTRPVVAGTVGRRILDIREHLVERLAEARELTPQGPVEHVCGWSW
jgi:hypothetical protein